MTKTYKTSIKLEEDFSYEVRFYCDFCEEEVEQNEQKKHAKECELRQKWNCPHDSIDMRRQSCVDCGESFYEE